MPDEKALAKVKEEARYSGETSARQVFNRLVGTWTYWAWKGGYFTTEDDAKTYYDEMVFMLSMQMAAPNSPQWFNTGLHWAYGIDGPSQGHFYVDYQTGKMVRSKSSYEHPQPHACFIQSVDDDLVNEGGIMDYGCVKPDCLNMALVPARTSHACGFGRACRGRQIFRPDEL